MEEKLNMGKKERTRGKILAMVVECQITLRSPLKTPFKKDEKYVKKQNERKRII